jgi:trafficking protein particle complex subunit 10
MHLCFSDLDELGNADSILNIKYGISGDRTTGAHSPVPVSPGDSEELTFKIALKLKRPVLDPCLAVGFLPFSTGCLRVGQLANMRWRVERLKSHEDASISCVSLQNILAKLCIYFYNTIPL